jgi:hypothetical protein
MPGHPQAAADCTLPMVREAASFTGSDSIAYSCRDAVMAIQQPGLSQGMT